MAKTRRKRFVVEGTGRFPLDMLRHDSCWPATSNDASEIELRAVGFAGRRKIVLLTDQPNYPTVGRWNSFLWSVVEEGYA